MLAISQSLSITPPAFHGVNTMPPAMPAPSVPARGSMFLNGSTDYYTYNRTAAWDMPNADFSIVFLVKMDFAVTSSTARPQHLLSAGNFGSNNNLTIYIDNALRVRYRTTVSTDIAGTAIPADKQWYVLCFRRNGAVGELVVCPYNGTAAVTGSATLNTPAAITPNLTTIYVGARHDLSSTRYLENNISYMAKVNSLLTNADIEQLAQGKDLVTDLAKTPAVYTKFESAGTTITDALGNVATKMGNPVLRGGADKAGLPIRIDTKHDNAFNRIYQRTGTSRDIVFTGDYLGSPTGIEARLIDSTNTPVGSWIDATTPTAGRWAATINVPQGHSYTLEVRHKNVASTSQRTTQPFGVGMVLFGAGQSNMENMKTFTTARTLTPRIMGVYDEDITGFFDTRLVNAGAGFGELLFQLGTALNIPVLICNAAWSGSALIGSGSWSDAASNPSQRFRDVIAAVGDCEGIIWHQGEADADNGVTQAAYETAFATVVSRLRSEVGRTAANLPVYVWTLGRRGSAFAGSTWPAIRAALINSANTITNAKQSGGAFDLTLNDALHYDSASYARLGNRIAQAVLSDVNGGFCTSAAINGNDIVVTVNLAGATALQGLTGSTGITGFTVRNAANVVQTISTAVITASNQVTLTLASTPAVGWKVDYINGDTVTNTNLLYTNKTVVGDTRGVPVLPTVATITL